jgi:hypothetical protein
MPGGSTWGYQRACSGERWPDHRALGGVGPPREKLVEWHNATLGRSNLIVSIAGNLSEGDAGSFADRVFGALPSVPEPPPLPEPSYKGLDKVIKIEHNAPQVYVRLYGVLERDDDPIKTQGCAFACDVRPQTRMRVLWWLWTSRNGPCPRFRDRYHRRLVLPETKGKALPS